MFTMPFATTSIQPSMQFLVMSILLIALSGCTNEQPRKQQEPLPEEDSGSPLKIPEFNGSRAFRYLVAQTDFGPRNPNSQGHAACLTYLATELSKSADRVQLQEFTAQGYGEKLYLTNIIASFKPDAKERILLCAHWDTRPRAEHDDDRSRRNEPILGANDGASGVAVLLELASLLKEYPPPVGVDIILFDGEDYGMEGDLQKYLLGSRHFAKNKPPDYFPRFGILLDMVGDKSLELPKEEHSVRYAPDIVDLVWRTARLLGITLFQDEIGPAVHDDHIPLNEVGIKTVNIIDFSYPDFTHRYWHTHKDTPDKCSPESLEAVGTVVTHVVYSQRP